MLQPPKELDITEITISTTMNSMKSSSTTWGFAVIVEDTPMDAAAEVLATKTARYCPISLATTTEVESVTAIRP